jgi:putative alpha-1,2-mannosidase
VSRILNEMYKNSPAGYSGNDDCGQMSAWYIFSSIGFYPVNPSSGIYIFGSPSLKQAEIILPDGKKFTVKTINSSTENIYIQSAKLNKKDYTKTYITHHDISNGGELTFVMGKCPNKTFAANIEDTIPALGY